MRGKRRFPLIAREGMPIIGAFLAAAVLAQWGLDHGWALAPLALAIGALWLFRDPARTLPAVPLGILSPMQGRVLSVTEVRDPWLEREAVRVRIRTRMWDTYSVFCPMEGKVQEHWCRGEDAERNPTAWGTRHTVWIRSDEGDDVVLSIAITHLLGRLRFYFNPGERVGQGQRCGFLFFGGRADVLLPVTCVPECQPDMPIEAASDLLARLIHEDAGEVVAEAAG